MQSKALLVLFENNAAGTITNDLDKTFWLTILYKRIERVVENAIRIETCILSI